MKITTTVLLLVLFLYGCTQGKLSKENETLHARVQELETQLQDLKNQDKYQYAIIADPTQYNDLHLRYTEIENFIKKHPTSQFTSKAKSLLEKVKNQLQEARVDEIEEAKWTLMTINEIQSDLYSVIDKKVVVNAEIDLGEIFGGGYSNYEKIYASFKIVDDTGSAHVYGSKEWIGTENLQKAIRENGRLNRRVKIILHDRIYRDGGGTSLHAELLGFEPIR